MVPTVLPNKAVTPCGRHQPTESCLQAAGRRVACHALAHVLAADLAWHRGRRTGSLSRTIERGEPLLLCR